MIFTKRDGYILISVLAMLSASVLYPPLRMIRHLGLEAAFNNFAADAFYYLSVAKLSHPLFFTFDGEPATNGFHPLWQWTLLGLSALSRNTDAMVNLTFYLSIATVWVGILIFGYLVWAETRTFVLPILLCPGVYYMLFGQIAQYVGSPWGYMNGMESGVQILFGGGTALFLARISRSQLTPQPVAEVLCGILAGLLVLSRLDTVFILPGLLVYIIMVRPTWRERIIMSVRMTGPAVVLITTYLIYNGMYSTTVMPTSGSMKSGLVVFSCIKQFILEDLFSPGAQKGQFRMLQMAFPFMVALVAAVYFIKNRRSPLVWLVPFIIYIIFYVGYNIVFVKMWHQGHWYGALTISISNLLIVLGMARYYAQVPQIYRIGLGSGVILAVVFWAADYAKYRNEQSDYYRFYKNRDQVAVHLAGRKIIEHDDGILNFSLPNAAISGFGLAADKESVIAKRNGCFMKLAYNRGFRTIGSLYYINSKPAHAYVINENSSQEEIVATLQFKDATNYWYSLVYTDPESGAIFLDFQPRDQ